MKNTLLKGTLLLTVSGLLTRLLGFFYRIRLASLLGAEYLGIYQMIFPIYGICYSLFAAGLQSAISGLTAGASQNGAHGSVRRLFRTALLLSVGCASILTTLVILFAEPIATHLLLEPRCFECLRILPLAFPFCALTSCINGYFLGQKKALVPSVTQLVEQLFRIGFVLFLLSDTSASTTSERCILAVAGLVIGELASMIFNLIAYLIANKPAMLSTKPPQSHEGRPLSALLTLALPLTFTRLMINVLHSLEAVFVPAMLRLSGCTAEQAISLFGILNGMTLPFLLFPSAIPNAMATLLLPAVSETRASADYSRRNRYIAASFRYSFFIGIPAMVFFYFFGNEIGRTVFHNQEAGRFLSQLAFLCPLLYLSTTLSGVINGLGSSLSAFYSSVFGMLIRLAFIVTVLPKTGINGYLTALLVSQLFTTLVNVRIVVKETGYCPNILPWVLENLLFSFFPMLLLHRLFDAIRGQAACPDSLLLLGLVGLCGTIYLAGHWIWYRFALPGRVESDQSFFFE